MRAGTTLLEIGITLTVIGVLSGIAMPGFGGYLDRIAVDAAATSTMSLLAAARHAALRRATIVTMRLDPATATVLVVAGADTLARRPLGEVHGVLLATSRDSIAWAPTGLGYGAANAQVILRRGLAAETIAISRLGRARRQ